MTDRPRDDNRTREMALPEKVSNADPDQTRFDEPAPVPQPRPQSAKATAPQVVPPEPPAPQPPSPPQPVQTMQAPRPGPLPPPPPAPSLPAPPPEPTAFHRFHYAIGVFLAAYGITTLVVSFLGWSAHRTRLAAYLSEGVATPALIAVKAVEALLVLITLAGLVRRRDVWFLPALFGWMLGFAVFCILDGAKGKMMDLVEHGAYLAVFAFLLCLSYALGVKVRVAGRQAEPQEPAQPQGTGSGRLTRTQEIALAALNRWQRQQPHQPPQPPQPPQYPPQPPQYPPQPAQPYGAPPPGQN